MGNHEKSTRQIMLSTFVDIEAKNQIARDKQYHRATEKRPNSEIGHTV